MTSNPVGPLQGVRVLDLSHIASGPFATMLLADMGADVIKVERTGTGDGSRQMDVSVHDGFSGYYLGLNKNKRSIAIDLASDAGRVLVLDLARQADVVIENLRPGAARRLGLGYQDVSKVKPDIIYCSISGFGDNGPLRDAIAYDIVGQALGGIMEITGDADRAPAKCGAPIADLTSGMYAALGIVSALHHRGRTGEGQYVQTSLLGATASLVSSYVTSQAMGTEFGRVGSAHNTLAPYQAFEGSDGRCFILAAANDYFFRLTVELLNRTDLRDDERFATNGLRTQNRADLATELAASFIERPADEWVARLREAGVPASEIRRIEELRHDEQVLANGYLAEVDQPGVGLLPMTVAPLTFSRTPVRVRRPAPALDEHRAEIVDIATGRAPWIHPSGLTPVDSLGCAGPARGW